MKHWIQAAPLLLLTSLAFAQSSSTTAPREPALEETVSVTGEGRVSLAPDRVMFTAGVETIAATAEEAVRLNNTKVAAVIAALKKAGAADREIRTSNFSLYPQQEYVENRRPRVTGYQAVNQVTLTRDEITGIGKYLQSAVDAGANNVSGLAMIVRDPQKGRNEGLKMAFEDARAKATLLAQSAGRSLGRALAITEGTGIAPPRPMYGKMVMAQAMESRVAQDVPVETGSQEITFAVSVIFEMR